ncbi:glycosyltransferase family 2 protein [Ectothiorhodospira variabilis]|uniref:glycosyltransferase family 2 protein n=1 Tax=Ectothiorhodospira variabilis TaxID=505694 RepID=UPI001EFBFA21|nr:glycosyltransferase family 2 protein [Ectothiorhodospira variabilis]MCG5504933.1 glycosyltransferase family 2 protein [Ectothiorhodospira variabilis]MCG5508090.1 glycosyltransferase family 2 protein [Ectothiorhodospira variabilis]
MPPAPPKIAIVIPYFQRDPGLLKQCVQSIMTHMDGIDAEILVVDDASPIPAWQEIGELAAEPAHNITIIEQPNAGPAAARNRGLDAVAPDTPFVAFLDSDDCWTGPFLSDAVSALNRDYDLFIGNTTRVGIKRSRFDWDANPKRNLYPEHHILIDPERETYEFVGDFFDFLVYRTNIIGPSAIAYRFDRFPTTRFQTQLFQGEDRLFKLALGQHLGKVAFSPKLYGHEGEGVNIFDKAGWGTEGSLRLARNYIAVAKMILGQITLNTEQQAHVQEQLSSARQTFTASLLHLLRHREPVDWQQVRLTFQDDPATAALLLPNMLRLATNRLSLKTTSADERTPD